MALVFNTRGQETLLPATFTLVDSLASGCKSWLTDEEGPTSSGELERELLRDLRVSDPRDDKERIERSKGGLLWDSFRWVLDHDDFRQWQDDGQSRMLWVKGDPGKGKTMLMCGIITELEKRPAGTVLSYFLCQATDARLNNATAVLRGLIYLLLDQQPFLIERLRKKYDHAGKQIFEDVNSWDVLSRTLLFILQDLGSRTTYLVIDALDECETDLSQLLHLIIQASSTTQAKWLLSSRNRRDIEQVIRPRESQTRLSLELKENAELVSRAVNTYISQCISQLAVLEGDVLQQDRIRSEIQQKANGTFLWVSLVIQELHKAEVWEVMDIINDIPAGLDKLYERMIRQIESQGRDRPNHCWKLLSTVAAAYRPLHLEELRVLVDLPPSVSATQQNIAAIAGRSGSFLTIRDNVVYIIHQSAKDFLTKHIAQHPSGLVAVHNIVASLSIQAMKETLGRDMYKIRKPGFPISRVKPPDPDPLASVRYSCVYWVSHLAEGCNEQSQWGRELCDGGPVYTFLKKHLLHWFEALSLLGSLSEGILQVSRLANLMQLSLESPKLTDLARDALRFIRANRGGIEISPLQVYTSALIFCPKLSTIRTVFGDEEPQWITIKPAVEDNWSACLQTLEGHKAVVSSVVFCSNRMQLVSSSWDSTVKIWDITTGQCIQTFLVHTCKKVTSVALASDGRHFASGFASGFENCIVTIWDRITGHCIKTLKGHTGSVDSVVFFGASSQMASASSDRTIKIWDINTGHCLKTLAGHVAHIYSLTLSGDNRQLASGSLDHTVKIWDTVTGHCIKTLSGHTGPIFSTAFSNDGMQLASASAYNCIKIWDITVERCVQTLEGHRGKVVSVIFSADGMQLASASADKTIKIWDRSTGQCVQTLTGHTGMVHSITFTKNNMQLVSASADTTIKIWDMATSQRLQTHNKHHTSALRSVAFSDDNTQLVSTSDDRTVKIWDSTGRYLNTLKGHTEATTSAAFLENNTKVVSRSYDNSVKIWHKATGRCLKTLESHKGRIISVSVTDRATAGCLQTRNDQRYHQPTYSSMDSLLLASLSMDKTIKIWDIATGQCRQTLDHKYAVSTAFSSDSTQLASFSRDGMAKIWDVATGQCLRKFVHNAWHRSAAFSNNSMQLASTADDTLMIWDTSTGQCRRKIWMRGRDASEVGQISFSETDLQLHTNIGTIDLRPGTGATSRPRADAAEAATFCGAGVPADALGRERFHGGPRLRWRPALDFGIFRGRPNLVAARPVSLYL
ncbi:WD40-repeat-containing domain protein [Colletotrichum navitas]|uniref:Mitochondrial division protein 1 n=1 Tax=Colletotrichum navitas TaxID=681940 RepID=A0AAD8PUX2_9PEZI|nr:WD40-repeat-containing domain protein [Colletotrichum navitas]KAK1585139.1 WD40-repeat-containing domain protein [Colletotrichum navitas]